MKILKNKNVDVLFECVGLSDGISKKIVEMALKNKINVITPNKALIAKHGDYLAKLAEKNNVNLEFEASVAGGIPILRTLKDGLATNKINKVYGILNGTTNYILTEMEKTAENFDKVLKKAQLLGYAEPGNPKLDLNGFDAFAKIRILSALCFNNLISQNKCIMEGIENIDIKDIKIAGQLNLRIKLLGISEIINKAKKPFIVWGQGVILGEAEKEFTRFIEKSGIPAAWTILGLSAVPTNHPLNVGMVGMHGNYGPNVLTNECDVLIAIGMRFDDRVTGSLSTYAKQAKIIHFEIDPAEVNKNVVADVAVFGVPNEEMGEEVKAVVQPEDTSLAGEDLEAELMAYCREHISHVKCPKSIDFREELPRHPTGKLYKRLLKDEYWKS